MIIKRQFVTVAHKAIKQIGYS